MNFPLLPIIPFVAPPDLSLNVWASALLAGICVLWALCVFGEAAVKNRYSQARASWGFLLLIIGVVIAVFGMYNLVFTVVLICILGAAFWVIYVFITLGLWEFLCKFILWRLLVKNILVAISQASGSEQEQPKKKVPSKGKKGSV